MLAIRLKRTGRKGHAQFRVVAQDSRVHPSSGRVVAYLGSYDPHTKVSQLDVEKISQYLANGAQPSERAVKLLKQEKVKLPSWVNDPSKKQKEIRNMDKLRRNRPAEEVVPEKPAEEPVAEAETVEEAPVEAPVEEAQPSKEA
jgi:small subunit ribosomal protein S16